MNTTNTDHGSNSLEPSMSNIEMLTVVEEKLAEKLKPMMDKIIGMERRLFVDNGNLSMQSKINKNGNAIALIIGVLTIIGTFALGVFGWLLKSNL